MASRGVVTELTRTFEAWRVIHLGTREVIDAVVAPEHRGPSPELTEGLAAWPGAHYWADAAHGQIVLVRSVGDQRRERWLLHIALFLLTVICALGAGAALIGAWYPPEGPVTLTPAVGRYLGGILSALAGGGYFFAGLLNGGWREILPGWSFAAPLLTILLVHELGHYFTARRYAIDASPPYFLPMPPTLSPIGSLGAFLRLRTPVLDRRQLLDVGAAGPLAGFAVTLIVLIWGYHTSQPLSLGSETPGDFVTFAGRQITLGDSLLTLGLRRLMYPEAAALYLSLPAFAGWVGAFITALNLLPLSQLDGGHVLYALVGRFQAAIGFLTLLGLVVLAPSSPSWYVWVVVVLLVGGGRWAHPSVVSPARPVPRGRRWIGWLCILIFIGTFVPMPFKL
jgi:membrane-associated protease RseP (regulator of RpoE activity)